jgi:hypothetical protein
MILSIEIRMRDDAPEPDRDAKRGPVVMGPHQHGRPPRCHASANFVAQLVAIQLRHPHARSCQPNESDSARRAYRALVTLPDAPRVPLSRDV